MPGTHHGVAAASAPVIVSQSYSAAGASERLATEGHPEVRVAHGYVFQHLLLGPHTVIEHGRQARAAVTNELLDHLGPRRDAFLATLVELCEHTDALAQLTARRLRPDGSLAFAEER